jgi:polar amino acid transport system permease protein
VDSPVALAPTPGHRLAIARRPQWGRWAGAAATLVFAAWIVFQLFTNPGFEWQTVGRYLFNREIVAGVAVTCELTVAVMVLGSLIGLVIALMKRSGDPVMLCLAGGYIWFFRGTPVLVQLVFWYNLASLFPAISLGIPFGGPKFYEIPSNTAITPLIAALLGLGLNEGAYMAEIIRAGILSVDPGQAEAARALGYRPFQRLWVIVLPQALKSIVPPTGNQVIGMLKYSSLASIVALPELMEATTNIYSRTFETIPLLVVASLWYLVLTTVLSIGQHFIERQFRVGPQAARRARLFGPFG